MDGAYQKRAGAWVKLVGWIHLLFFSLSFSLSLSLSLPLSTSFSLALSVRVSLRSWLRLTLTRTWWDMVHKYIYGFQWTVLSAYIERQTVAGPDPNPTFAMININVARKMNISGAECTRIRSNYVQSVWQQKVQKMLALIKNRKKIILKNIKFYLKCNYY